MKKGSERKRKRAIIFSLLSAFLLVSALTTPSKEDYIKFSEAETGIPIPENVLLIEEADFIFFAIYATAPKNTVDEYGIAHLGFMGHFFKITDGQYDDSIWEGFLN